MPHASSGGAQAYLVGGCVRDILLKREPVDYDVATDATPDRVQQLFPRSLAVGAQFGVIMVTGRSGARDARGAGGSGDVSLGCWLFRRPASGPGGLYADRRKKTCGGATSRSTRCCSIRKPAKCSISSAGRKDLEGGDHPRHWRSGRALSRRQAAHDSRGALRRAFRLRDRARDVRGHPETRAPDPSGFRRAHSRRTDEAAHRRRGAARLRTARREPACCRKSCRKLRE